MSSDDRLLAEVAKIIDRGAWDPSPCDVETEGARHFEDRREWALSKAEQILGLVLERTTSPQSAD